MFLPLVYYGYQHFFYESEQGVMYPNKLSFLVSIFGL